MERDLNIQNKPLVNDLFVFLVYFSKQNNGEKKKQMQFKVNTQESSYFQNG